MLQLKIFLFHQIVSVHAQLCIIFLKMCAVNNDRTDLTVTLSSIEHVLSILNSFHQNIEFTYELEQNGTVNFLDVMLIRTNDTLQTTIYRKSTHNGVYLHWNSFAPRTWKCGTLWTRSAQLKNFYKMN